MEVKNRLVTCAVLQGLFMSVLEICGGFFCVCLQQSFWECINFINIHKNVNFDSFFYSGLLSLSLNSDLIFIIFPSTYVDISCTLWEEWEKVCLLLPSHQHKKYNFEKMDESLNVSKNLFNTTIIKNCSMKPRLDTTIWKTEF